MIVFTPRRKCLLITWLPSLSIVILDPKNIKSVTASTFSPPICHEEMGPDAMILIFLMLSFKQAFSLCSFTPIERFFSSSLLSAVRMVSSAYIRLLIFLLEILTPACDSSSLACHTIYSADKLNKQGDNIQPCLTPFPVWNKSVVTCPILTVASCPTYRFFRRQVRWSVILISKNFPQFVVIHTVKGLSVVNEAEVDVFLEFFCFLYDPVNVGNLISGSSASLKHSLYIWKFSVHVQLKPSLENFEHYFASVWASLVAERVKRLPAMWETWVQSLGQEDLLEKEKAIHSSTLAWKIPWMDKPGRLQSIGLQRVRHDWVTSLSLC